MFDLTDKVAVVTGGASGIGLATARRFTAAGATAVVVDLADGEGIARELGGAYVRTDVSDEQQVADLMEKVAQRYGRVDILVNNAGIALGDDRPITAEVYDNFRKQFEVNVMGVVYGIKHVAAHMPDGGTIINTSSMAGVLGFPNFSSYEASKWGVIGVTKTAALELASRNIRVNAVCPTGVETPMMAFDVAPIHEVAMIEYLQPINRLATAEEVAAAIHFLAADDCAMVTGHALHVDGGLYAGPGTRGIELAISRYREDVADDVSDPS